MITASNSTGDIKIYFNNDNVNNSFAYPGNNAAALNHAMDDTLIAYINRASYSLDIAIYNWINFNLSDITGAVNDAHARGVQVRVIGNGSTSNTGMAALNAGINKLLSPTTSNYGIMHNKFVVIDAASSNANDSFVWTGSTNWTDQQINADINNVVIIQDQSLAKTYTMEFEEMWGSSGVSPNVANSKFGPDKTDNTPHDFNIGGLAMQSYFSPSDGVGTRIIETINTADHEFNFAVMDLTRSDIANAIKQKYNSFSDSCSAGILDDTVGVTGAGGPFFTMKSAMNNRLKIHLDTNIMHCKYMIIDAADASSDPTVLTGSHNWTNAADQLNDENTLIIHDNYIANKYYQNFAAVFELEGGTSCNYVCPAIPIVNAGNDQTYCSNTADVILSGTVGGFSTGSIWSGGTGIFYPDAATLNAIYTPSQAEKAGGSVTLTLTSGNSCTAVSDYVVFTFSNCTGFTNIQKNERPYLFPNPFLENLSLQIDDSWIGSNVIVYNTFGEIFYQAKVCQDKFILSTEDFPSGLYIIQLQSAAHSVVLKAMK
jgi:phosphatidylserine/phosphatidylglycerophosphate/cardiolipin synthase-like enzyme